MLGRLKRWLGRKLNVSISRRHGTRLGLEGLEGRDTPAAFYYSPLGADHLSTNPVNYLLDSPLGVRAAPNSPAPGPNDHIYCRAATTGNADLIVPLGQTTVAPPPDGAPPTPVPGNTYAGLHETDGYAGTVQLQKSLAVGTLELASAGKIWQNDPTVLGYAGDLWVTSTFNWTAGTLNSGTVAGGVTLSGATGTAAPTLAAPNSTVSLGSSLTLATNLAGLGSTLNVFEGEYDLTRNEAGFVVGEHCTLNCKAPVPKSPPPIPGAIVIDGEDKTKTAKTKGALEVKIGGTATVQPADRTTDNAEIFASLEFKSKDGVSDLVNAGTLTLKDKTRLVFNHTADAQLDMPNGGLRQKYEPVTIDAPAPLFQIEAGCQIFCQGRAGVQITDGSVELTERLGTDNKPLASQPDVEIDGSSDPDFADALFLRQNAKIRKGQGRTVPIQLKLDGQFTWDGNIDELYADHTTYDKNDRVEVTKRVIVETHKDPEGQTVDPVLDVFWFDDTQGQPVSAPYTGGWTLVASEFKNAPNPAQQFDPIQGEPEIIRPPVQPLNLATTAAVNAAKNKIEMKPSL